MLSFCWMSGFGVVFLCCEFNFILLIFYFYEFCGFSFLGVGACFFA